MPVIFAGKLINFRGMFPVHWIKTAQRFVGESIYGMLCSQSVMLTEIERTLQSTVSLKKIEERFCRQLQKPGLWHCIHHQVLVDAGPRIAEEMLLILDLSDITKKYAQKMEYLATVRDGSSDGELTNGYWPTHVIGAELDSERVLPLYQELYSQEAPDLKAKIPRVWPPGPSLDACGQRLWREAADAVDHPAASA